MSLRDLPDFITCSGFVMLTDPKDENIRLHLKNEGMWEPDATEIVKAQFSGGIFLDVGAHWGYYSMLLAPQSKHIYAIEPNPVTFKYLCLNVVLNGFTNVTTLLMAGWDSVLNLTPSILHSNTGGAGVGVESGITLGVRLDELFKSSEIDFIKIDCEGSDDKVIRGAEGILKEGHHKLLAESPPSEYLGSLGYNREWSSNNKGQGTTSLWVK